MRKLHKKEGNRSVLNAMANLTKNMKIKTIKFLTNLKMVIEDAPLYEDKEFEKRLEDIIAKLYWELCISKWDKEDRMINAGYEEHKTNEELEDEKNDYHPHWSEIQ